MPPRVEGANIHNHLRVVLDMKGTNYSVWRGLMEETMDQYDVANHVSPDFDDHHDDPSWKIFDKAMKKWFYGSMTTFVQDRGATAYQLWSSLEALFLNNKRSRQFHLKTELYAVRQGYSSVSGFCARLKSVADGLRNVGKPVDDDEMVIQLLRGINRDRHGMTAKIIEKAATPFLQDEMTSGGDFAAGHHTALAAHGRPAAPGASSGGPSGGHNNQQFGAGSGGGKPSTPSPNQVHNKRRRFTKNGGYRGPSLVHGRAMCTPTPSHSLRRLVRLPSPGSSDHARPKPSPPSRRFSTGDGLRPLFTDVLPWTSATAAAHVRGLQPPVYQSAPPPHPQQ